jgi:hypothetical protein
LCQDCRTKKDARYEGKKLILTSQPCNWSDCTVVEHGAEIRCVNCGHQIRGLVDPYDPSTWENPVWLKNGQPVRRDQV